MHKTSFVTQICLMWQAIVPSTVSILPEEIFCSNDLRRVNMMLLRMFYLSRGKNIPCTIFNINVVSAWGKRDKMCYFGKLE